MIFEHIRTGRSYRMLFASFNASTQRQDIVYICMKTGVVFNKDAEKFYEGMKYTASPQEDVTPDPKQAEFKFDEHS